MENALEQWMSSLTGTFFVTLIVLGKPQKKFGHFLVARPLREREGGGKGSVTKKKDRFLKL